MDMMATRVMNKIKFTACKTVYFFFILIQYFINMFSSVFYKQSVHKQSGLCKYFILDIKQTKSSGNIGPSQCVN